MFAILRKFFFGNTRDYHINIMAATICSCSCGCTNLVYHSDGWVCIDCKNKECS